MTSDIALYVTCEPALVPVSVRNVILSDKKHQKPINDKELAELWDSSYPLIVKYSVRISEQYNSDIEELIQEAYLFYLKIIEEFSAASCCIYKHSDVCNPTCQFWNDCLYKYAAFGWDIWEVKPVLYKKLYHKMRYYAQRHFTYNNRLFDSNVLKSDSDDVDSVVESISYQNSYQKNSPSDILERKSISERLHKALDDLIETQFRSTKKEVAVLYFKQGFDEKDIYKVLNKSQSTINSHLSAIKYQIRNHPDIVEMVEEFKNLGISEAELV